MWGFPRIRGTILKVPIVRTRIFWGLRWGPLILGNYHVDSSRTQGRLTASSISNYTDSDHTALP